ncbi:MAG TPA: pseudouridine synthase [Casimicrobiaceae bacterium]
MLASCGFGSRRAMEELILAGRITVNRMPAEIGQKVGPGDEVRINGEPVKIRFAEPPPRVLIYHKPPGEIVSRDDPEARTTVFEGLPPIEGAKWIAIGRLDYNTEGLLLFTNSGELANRLMHPRYEVEREYAVRIMGRLDEAQMQQLMAGVELEDGVAKCDKVEDGGGEEEGANHWYHVVLKEGRNREVRRLFEAMGVAVSRLIRTRYGRVSMPAAVKRGDVQELSPPEVNALLGAVGLRAPGKPQGKAARPPQGQRQGQPQGARAPQGQGGQPAQGAQGGARPPRHGRGKGQGGQGGAPRGNQGPGARPRDGQGNTRGPGPRADGNGPPRPHGKNGPRPGGNPFRPGKARGPGGHGQGSYGQEGNGNRQPRLTSHGQPPMTTHTQPQLTMHAQGFGRGNVPGAHRRNKGGGNTPPKQRWEGLPKDEDEPK